MGGGAAVRQIKSLEALENFSQQLQDKPITSFFGGRYYEKEGKHISLNALVAQALVLSKEEEVKPETIRALVTRIRTLDQQPLESSPLWNFFHWIRQGFGHAASWRDHKLKELDTIQKVGVDSAAEVEQQAKETALQATTRLDYDEEFIQDQWDTLRASMMYIPEKTFVHGKSVREIEQALENYVYSHPNESIRPCVLVGEPSKDARNFQVYVHGGLSNPMDVTINPGEGYRFQTRGIAKATTIAQLVVMPGIPLKILRPEALFPPPLPSLPIPSQHQVTDDFLKKVAHFVAAPQAPRLLPNQAVFQCEANDHTRGSIFYRAPNGVTTERHKLTLLGDGSLTVDGDLYPFLPSPYDQADWLGASALLLQSSFSDSCISKETLRSLEHPSAALSLSPGDVRYYIHRPFAPDSPAHYVLNVLSQGEKGLQTLTVGFKIKPDGTYQIVHGKIDENTLLNHLAHVYRKRFLLTTKQDVKKMLSEHSK